MTRSRAARATSTVMLVIATASGCSSAGADHGAAVIRRHGPEVAPGDPVVPTAAPVLHIRDGLERRDFDPAGLERLGLVETELHEPYVRQDLTFEGVSAEDLATYLDLDRDDRIQVVALDGYQVELEVGDLLDSDAILATRSGREEIALADGGPLRFVYPGDPLASDLDAWIWSVDTLTIERG